MLPDIRAAIAAIVAAVGLLMAAFGVVATLRVAQQHHSTSLQADLAARGRAVLAVNPERAANPGERAVLIIDTPGPHLLTPARSEVAESAATPEPAPPAPSIAVETAALEPLVVTEPPRATPSAETPPAPTPAETAQSATPAETAQAAPAGPVAPPAEPPIGGPLAEPPRPQSEAPRGGANDGNAKRADAEKARKERTVRAARQRKAAKRAAQARRAKQPQSSPSFGGTFGNTNQLGGTFRQ